MSLDMNCDVNCKVHLLSLYNLHHNSYPETCILLYYLHMFMFPVTWHYLQVVLITDNIIIKSCGLFNIKSFSFHAFLFERKVNTLSDLQILILWIMILINNSIDFKIFFYIFNSSIAIMLHNFQLPILYITYYTICFSFNISIIHYKRTKM